jgi:uncharacterized protein (TIGR00730 family)
MFEQTNDFRSNDPWRMFRIMAEFVEGFEEMAKICPAVSIFGSARTSPESKYYQWAEECAGLLAEARFNIITGGGPGIMEAANKGAKERGKGISVGLNIDLPFEQQPNPYITKELTFRYFFCRKVMFSKYSCAIIVMPGGFGTLDEMFENLTLVQTRKIPAMPIIFMGTDYWKGLLDWVKEIMLEKEHNISAEDLDLYTLTDDPQVAVDTIIRTCGARLNTVES